MSLPATSAHALLQRPLVQHLLALGSSILGTSLVVGLVLAMNASELREDKNGERAVAAFTIEPPQQKKPQNRPEPRPRPKRMAKTPPPPVPMVGASLSGLSFGLESLEGAGLGADADALLGEVGDVVMTEEAVDEPPRPAGTLAQPEYPERARSKGISGLVQLSLLIGADGRVQDVRVLESRPPGVFDEAATSAARQWRFSPATYQGRPVAIRVTQVLRFGFEG